MKFKYSILFLSFLCSFSCLNKAFDIDKEVKTTFYNCNSNEECLIDFKKALCFEWDKMYIFSSAISLEEVQKKTGINLERYYTDIGDRVIFVNNGRVVYYKEWFNNPERPTKGTVFKIKGNSLEKSIKDDVVFSIKKVNSFFYLTER